MINLPKNLPPLLAERLRQVVLSDTLGEALDVLIPSVLELFRAQDLIFVFNQDSADPNRCAQVTHVATADRSLTDREVDDTFSVWLKGGAHRAVLQALIARMSAASFSKDVWPYPRAPENAPIAFPFPGSYNLLLPFSSEMTVRELDEEYFFGYFCLIFPKFPEIEEDFLSLIVTLPKLLSEVFSALNRHFDSKIESLTVFTHDFKQFLLLNEQYLTRLRAQDQKDVLLIDKLFAANEKMLLQTNSIILSAREGSGFLRVRTIPVSLNELVVDTVSQLESGFKLSGIQLITDLGRDLPLAALDPAIFPSVIHNLLDNARKYSAKGSSVAISTSLAENGQITLEVADQGIGIPEAELPKIFSKSFRASNATPVAGHGLGLYLAKKIVEAHHGLIAVHSEAGKGTAFVVSIPCS